MSCSPASPLVPFHLKLLVYIELQQRGAQMKIYFLSRQFISSARASITRPIGGDESEHFDDNLMFK